MNKWMGKGLLALLLFVWLLPFTASAHDNSAGYSDITVEADRVTMHVFLEQIFLLDVAHLPWDGSEFDEAYMDAHREQMDKSVKPELRVVADGKNLQAQTDAVKLSDRGGITYVEFDYTYQADKPIEGLAITNNLYVRHNPDTHTNFATITVGDQQTEFIFESTKR
ncbi:MAG TPA: hypothetical protein VFV52_17150, partial [Bacilli bacterium]|nr:hypothetical protein [Bacilli bacterium]